jgi:hypothetical protein
MQHMNEEWFGKIDAFVREAGFDAVLAIVLAAAATTVLRLVFEAL